MIDVVELSPIAPETVEQLALPLEPLLVGRDDLEVEVEVGVGIDEVVERLAKVAIGPSDARIERSVVGQNENAWYRGRNSGLDDARLEPIRRARGLLERVPGLVHRIGGDAVSALDRLTNLERCQRLRPLGIFLSRPLPPEKPSDRVSGSGGHADEPNPIAFRLRRAPRLAAILPRHHGLDQNGLLQLRDIDGDRELRLGE